MRARTYVVAGVVLIGGWLLISAAAQNSGASQDDMTEEHKRTLTAVIQSHGFQCPKVKIATKVGPEPRGHAVRAYCGPVDRDGVYQNLKYRFIVRPNNEWLVEPW